jgi:hypothetical protein
MLICIEFERLKRLLDSTQLRRSIAMESGDLPGAKVASENMMTLSDLMFDHALRCAICNATVTGQYRNL